jgi:hypothetical protein
MPTVSAAKSVDPATDATGKALKAKEVKKVCWGLTAMKRQLTAE